MAERNRNTARPAEWPLDEGMPESSSGDALDSLDDAQVLELVSDAYWTLLEQFFSPEGAGADTPSAAGAS